METKVCRASSGGCVLHAMKDKRGQVIPNTKLDTQSHLYYMKKLSLWNMKIGMIQKFSGGTLYYSRIKGEVMVNRITNARFKQKLIPLEQELFQEYGNSSGYDF